MRTIAGRPIPKPAPTPSVPNPGSYAARANGCLCPQPENGFGRGQRDSHGLATSGVHFVIADDCPMHATKGEEES